MAALWLMTLAACSYTEKIRDGQTAFERKQYAVATGMLTKAYNKADTRLEKGKRSFLLGESYKALHKPDLALKWYETAYNNQYGVDALREYAFALKQAERYEEAINTFKELGIEIGSPYEYRREISACQAAAEWKAKPQQQYRVETTDFNTPAADYAPSLYQDGQLVFTSDRKGSTGGDTYNWTGNAFSDLYAVDKQTQAVKPFDASLNTGENEGTAVFDKNFTEIYFTRCTGDKKEDAFCKLMRSKRIGAGWSTPEPLPFMEPKVNYGHPSLSADGLSLYFSSNHPDGWGGYDIYVAQRASSAGDWGPPQLLSRSVNTTGNEKFPAIDGDTLYFSSDHHPGMGGLDIFKVYRLDNGAWSSPVNLKAPINSGFDDFGWVVDYAAPVEEGVLQAGYFSSSRPGGMGNDDIYRFERIVPPPAPVEEVPKDIAYKMILEGYVLEKIFLDPSDPNSKVLGRKPLAGATVEMLAGREAKKVTVAEDGFFTLVLAQQTDYRFVASKEAYLTNQTAFSTRGIGQDPDNPVTTYEVEVVLDRIVRGKEIRLENIYYDFDKWDIREDARPTLDALTENLLLNPAIRIQLSSHTDCRGNDRYNETLSQRRAQSAVDYLIGKGISAERLEAKGYGESRAETNCACARCTEEEHQINRRTTFTILE